MVICAIAQLNHVTVLTKPLRAGPARREEWRDMCDMSLASCMRLATRQAHFPDLDKSLAIRARRVSCYPYEKERERAMHEATATATP